MTSLAHHSNDVYSCGPVGVDNVSHWSETPYHLLLLVLESLTAKSILPQNCLGQKKSGDPRKLQGKSRADHNPFLIHLHTKGIGQNLTQQHSTKLCNLTIDPDNLSSWKIPDGLYQIIQGHIHGTLRESWGFPGGSVV